MSDLQERRLQLESVLKGAELRQIPHLGLRYVNADGMYLTPSEYERMRVELAMAVLGMVYKR